ncbi:Uncharacterised protein [Mycobacteroides abscessus subsp. abscessus]|nr:Uncharacterised protein [Mycobacteroides abscessus subsp. abscessus]
MSEVGGDDECPEADGAGDGRRRGQYRHAGEPAGIAQTTPDEVVVGPGVVEAHLLGPLPQRAGVPPVQIRENADSKAHAVSLVLDPDSNSRPDASSHPEMARRRNTSELARREFRRC